MSTCNLCTLARIACRLALCKVYAVFLTNTHQRIDTLISFGIFSKKKKKCFLLFKKMRFWHARARQQLVAELESKKKCLFFLTRWWLLFFIYQRSIVMFVSIESKYQTFTKYHFSLPYWNNSFNYYYDYFNNRLPYRNEFVKIVVNCVELLVKFFQFFLLRCVSIGARISSEIDTATR